MTPSERLALKRLFARMRDLNRSEASCYCGRRYKLNFDTDLASDLDIAEAIIDKIKTSWLEID